MNVPGKDCNKTDTKSIFESKTANEWIKQAFERKIPEMLFHQFWYENELCILVGDTGAGKSLLAVQIADEISNSQKVIYYDFELSDKQFQLRYTNIKTNTIHKFNENFIRVQFNANYIPDNKTSELNSQRFNNELEKTIINSRGKIIIIDNITYLLMDYEETAKKSLPLLKYLKTIKQKYGLSILVLAHTPKRDDTKPITLNDVGGSKMLTNFSDSVFCIGKSRRDINYRYIKQLKIRNGELLYDSENVRVYEIENINDFTKLYHRGFAHENEHLKEISESEKTNIEINVIKLKKDKPDMTFEEIAILCSTNRMRVSRILKKSTCNTITDN